MLIGKIVVREREHWNFCIHNSIVPFFRIRTIDVENQSHTNNVIMIEYIHIEISNCRWFRVQRNLSSVYFHL